MKLAKPLFILVLLCSSIYIQATDLGGNITSDSTITADLSPYQLQSDLIVDAGVTLTIEAGVAIEFPATGIDFQVFGNLIALGAH